MKASRASAISRYDRWRQRKWDMLSDSLLRSSVIVRRWIRIASWVIKYQASQAGLLPNGINVSPTKNSKPAAIKAIRCIGPIPSKLPAWSRSTANMAKRATKPTAVKPSPICLLVVIGTSCTEEPFTMQTILV